MLTNEEILALRLIDSNAELLHKGNVIVSRSAAALLKAGAIDYAPERNAAYRLTPKGRAMVELP